MIMCLTMENRVTTNETMRQHISRESNASICTSLEWGSQSARSACVVTSVPNIGVARRTHSKPAVIAGASEVELDVSMLYGEEEHAR